MRFQGCAKSLGMSLQPTAFALRLAPKIRAALTALTDALVEEPPFDPQTAQRRFKVAMTDAGQQVFLPQLAQATRHASGVQLQSFPLAFDGSLAQALGEGIVDLVIGPLPEEAQANLEVWPLFTERYVAILPRRILGKAQSKISLAQLKQLPLLVVEQESTRHRLIPQALQALGLQGQIRYRVPYFSVVAPMINACDTVAFVPSQIARRLPKTNRVSEQIVVCDLPFHLDPYTVSLARHPRFARDQGINWLAQLAYQRLSVPHR
jgi:DNA-binding transcriptional LysR family regulator